MGEPVTYPDGSTLTSSALTIAQINGILQPLTMGMLGIAADPASSRVRVEWPALGAPFQETTDDVCYIACTIKDDPYNKIRDRFNGEDVGEDLAEQWNYTRIWKIHWTAYGPNSEDSLRALRSALYQDYFTEALSNSQLFPMSDISDVVRLPELTNAQWFERADVECEMYEFITETINRATIASVEVIASESIAGQFADITVTGGS